jgi:hypothetical protein
LMRINLHAECLQSVENCDRMERVSGWVDDDGVRSAIWRLLPARHEVTRFAITGSCGRQNRRRTLLKSPVMQLLSALKIAEIEL